MNCPKCGFPLELNRWGTFWFHANSVKGKGCGIVSIPAGGAFREPSNEELNLPALQNSNRERPADSLAA